MPENLMFTQSEVYVENRRKQCFLLIGILPILLFTVFMTWMGGVGAIYFNLSPNSMMRGLPFVVMLQVLLLAICQMSLRRAWLRLSSNQLEVWIGEKPQRWRLKDMTGLRVYREASGEISSLRVRFRKGSLHLKGFLGMDVLCRQLSDQGDQQPEGTFHLQDKKRQ